MKLSPSSLTDAHIDRPVPNRPLRGYLARARRRDAKAIAAFKEAMCRGLNFGTKGLGGSGQCACGAVGG